MLVAQRQGHFLIGVYTSFDGREATGILQRQVGQGHRVLFRIEGLASPSPAVDGGAGVDLHHELIRIDFCCRVSLFYGCIQAVTGEGVQRRDFFKQGRQRIQAPFLRLVQVQKQGFLKGA